jgi:hypothetical protein
MVAATKPSYLSDCLLMPAILPVAGRRQGRNRKTRRLNPAPATPTPFRHFRLDVTWITEAVEACWYDSLSRSHLSAVGPRGRQGCPSSLRWAPLPSSSESSGWSLPNGFGFVDSSDCSGGDSDLPDHDRDRPRVIRVALALAIDRYGRQVAVHDEPPRDIARSARSSTFAHSRLMAPGALNMRRILSARSRSPRLKLP